ncbi:DNA-3-methyladenine glycosylase 2 family protein [Chelatococcus sp. SYSU_G07232]|uniref:DNA-3-methyladenine glycosylase II n=1 Tax=Chelatococcus albus TaxID=3047466 RepID=A0ABT7ALX0_9HYPH|nr:DNA-3-methyladenine glycosylase 2 family protein [Chelatococcus sp. SYSU_G07232]MDJ1159581.1 DNA-3-methyladenine glycosylase 2 family protein [Chelatococcus sp. SYSU_G07232]
MILDSEDALTAALEALAAHDPLFARLQAAGARPPLRKRAPGFAGLAGIIIAQQVSTASAAAIWGRFAERFRPLHHEAILAAGDDDLRAVGLSLPKMRTLRAIARAIDEGTLDLDALADMDAAAAQEALTAVKGIGPWTAEVYLLFCLGHADVFPAGDLALQEASRLALDLAARPDTGHMRRLAERWRPWRGAAAYALWAYYRIAKARDGAPLPTP